MAKTTFEINIVSKDNNTKTYNAPTKPSSEKLYKLNTDIVSALRNVLGEKFGELNKTLSNFSVQYTEFSNTVAELKNIIRTLSCW